MSGQSILNALEMGCRLFPKTGAGFLYVSGLKFEIDTAQPSTVVCDENGLFVRVSDARLVKNVMVFNRSQQKWYPLNPARVYRVVGCDYTLLNQGDGHRFPDVKVINPAICSYVGVIEEYLRHYCEGVVDKYRYGHPQGRITVR